MLYDDVYRALADEVDLAGTAVRVASVAHLVEMKRRAGRPQDLADVAALLELAGE